MANLALRLAISQMIAERAGQPLSLLILDEIFGSLDEDRRAAVVDLLRSLADRFPQVILITHIDSVREGFDRVIRVGFDVEPRAWHRARRAGRGARCGGLTGACAGPIGPPCATSSRSTASSPTRSPTATAATAWSASACRTLNPLVWRYAIEDAGDGAMIWRDADGQLVAFNMVHQSGIEGWMGPLAVRPDRQGEGLGSTMVRTGIDWLQGAGRAHHRARDDAAHRREHRILQPDRPGARAAHRDAGPRCAAPRRGRARAALARPGRSSAERIEECRAADRPARAGRGLHPRDRAHP